MLTDDRALISSLLAMFFAVLVFVFVAALLFGGVLLVGVAFLVVLVGLSVEFLLRLFTDYRATAVRENPQIPNVGWTIAVVGAVATVLLTVTWASLPALTPFDGTPPFPVYAQLTAVSVVTVPAAFAVGAAVDERAIRRYVADGGPTDRFEDSAFEFLVDYDADKTETESLVKAVYVYAGCLATLNLFPLFYVLARSQVVGVGKRR